MYSVIPFLMVFLPCIDTIPNEHDDFYGMVIAIILKI